MKINRIIASAAVVLPLIAFGRPASPEKMQHTNPDGTIVEFRMHGDEQFNYITTADGSTILEVDTKGTMKPAVRAGRILSENESDLQLLRSESKINMPSFKVDSFNSSSNIHRMAALDFEGRSSYPTVGEVNACVILLEFADTEFSMDDPNLQYTRFCNEEGYSDFGGRGSARDYFIATSNGKFKPTFDVYGPIKLEHNARWYVGKADNPEIDNSDDDPTLMNYGHNARLGYAIKQALEELDSTVDFSKYDLDNNGDIDNIFFFYSGYGQADTRNTDYVWPHQWDYIGFTTKTAGSIGLPEIVVDGVNMRTYACSNELNGSPSIPQNKRPYLDGIGAFCHEYGHVLGLPDLYDTRNSGCKEPGKYSVMANGSYNLNSTCPPLFTAYEQWVCHWLEYTTAEDGQSYTLNPLSQGDGETVRIRIPRTPTTYYPEYYVLECRDDQGWDEGLDDFGMYIWRINFTKSAWTSNIVNSERTPRVEILSTPASVPTMGWPGDDMKYTYIIPSMNVFTPASVNKTLDVTLSNINYDLYGDNVLTFDYNKVTQLTTAPVLHDNPSVEHATHRIHLAWDKVEGATDYQLTVIRRDGSQQFYVNGLDAKLVGDVDSYTITNVLASTWNQTFTAYVTPYNGVPGSKNSNIITFVPQRMQEGTGVEDIEADMEVIYGAKGCIVAPEGARVFNLSGVETGRENLPAGVYIVTTANATAKVIVR